MLYEGIKEVVRASSHLHVDETGWRVNGENWWLWAFVNDEAVLYVIDKSRGSKVPNGVLGERYGGILESDFYSVYDSIVALGKQKCQGHLLKDIKEIEEKNGLSLKSEDGRFLNELKSTLKEAITCWNGYKKGTKGIEELKEDKDRIISKMVELIQIPLEHPDTQRIRERIIKHEIIMSIIQTGILNKVEPLRLFLALTMREISFLEEIIQIRGP